MLTIANALLRTQSDYGDVIYDESFSIRIESV